MKDYWIRFGCFITGYNYTILDGCSEVAKKVVKRYTAAIIIVALLWSFIGYLFCRRYLHLDTLYSIIGSLIMVTIIVQIERQIILSQKSRSLFWSRALLAGLMSVIGAVIVDQIIFKDDIELEKITFIGERIKTILPPRTAELKVQISQVDSSIVRKEKERLAIIEEISLRPFVKSISTQIQPSPVTKTVTDTTGKIVSTQTLISTRVITETNVPNPKQELLPALDTVLSKLHSDKALKEEALLKIRPKVEQEIKANVGFLEELEIMKKILMSSGIALCFWIIWIIFFICLELLVLFTKAMEEVNDYDRIIHHQKDLHIKRIDLLKNAGG